MYAFELCQIVSRYSGGLLGFPAAGRSEVIEAWLAAAYELDPMQLATRPFELSDVVQTLPASSVQGTCGLKIQQPRGASLPRLSKNM
jgi:hypothetical protein